MPGTVSLMTKDLFWPRDSLYHGGEVVQLEAATTMAVGTQRHSVWLRVFSFPSFQSTQAPSCGMVLPALRAALLSVLNPLTHLPPSSMLLTQTRLPVKTSHCSASVRSPLLEVRDLRLSRANRIRQALCCRDESMGKNDGSVQSQVPVRSRVWPCTCNPRAASRDRKITGAVWPLL